ncbi:HNH endonuclease family protein [Kiloniella sp. b19]|uniref:HNH endonuclease family protein n=1 Tax=Kiloniella sp. GXU_MW_B19 TaxID=3141326 RepID=UPI0031D2E304
MFRTMTAIGLLVLAPAAMAHELPEYDRSEWPHWIDVDRDCQNLRAEMLIAESLEPVTFTNDKGCTVDTGKWVGPYGGETFTGRKQVDIDHIVPLKEAHRSGGWAWSRTLKQAFANDPENLLITSASLNRAKSDQDPAQWLDILPGYKCTYLRKWISIKERYDLTYDKAEKAFLKTELEHCE